MELVHHAPEENVSYNFIVGSSRRAKVCPRTRELFAQCALARLARIVRRVSELARWECGNVDLDRSRDVRIRQRVDLHPSLLEGGGREDGREGADDREGGWLTRPSGTRPSARARGASA